MIFRLLRVFLINKKIILSFRVCISIARLIQWLKLTHNEFHYTKVNSKKYNLKTLPLKKQTPNKKCLF